MLTALLQAKGEWVRPEKLATMIWAHAMVEPDDVSNALRRIAGRLAAFLHKSGYRIDHFDRGAYRMVWQRTMRKRCGPYGLPKQIKPSPSSLKREGRLRVA